MSFLTTVPEELSAAAAQLQAIGSSLTAQNAGAAAPTTGIIPAASDQVSALQAGIFTAYGTLYQQMAAEAQAIQEQFVNTLGLSSGTYLATEAANANASADPISQFSAFLNNVSTLLGGPTTSVGGQPFSLSGNSANFSSFEFGNFASASSDVIGMAGGGLLPAAAADTGDAAAAADLAGATGPAGAGMGGMGAMGGMPVAAGLGQATLVGNKLSVPPSWAGAFTPTASTGAAVQTVGWTGAAPQAATSGSLVPGMPGMATAGRNSAGFGAPRYGVKPIVMVKPAV